MCSQQRLGTAWASTQSDQSPCCGSVVAKDPRFLHADGEDSDQTGRLPKLIWVFTGRTGDLLVLLCCGSVVIAFERERIQTWNIFLLVVHISSVCFLNNIMCFLHAQPSSEPPHDKTNEMACAPSEDSDQPRHPSSQIRVLAVRMKKHWVLTYLLSAQRRLIRLGGCPGWAES